MRATRDRREHVGPEVAVDHAGDFLRRRTVRKVTYAVEHSPLVAAGEIPLKVH
jgi:hypothetical protein